MSVRMQNFRQGEMLPIIGTGASANGLGFTQYASPNNPLAAMRLLNATTSIAYFALGRGTATAVVPTGGTSSQMIPVAAGGDIVVDMDGGVNFVSTILGTSTATGTVYACPGEGS